VFFDNSTKILLRRDDCSLRSRIVEVVIHNYPASPMATCNRPGPSHGHQRENDGEFDPYGEINQPMFANTGQVPNDVYWKRRVLFDNSTKVLLRSGA